MSAVPAPETGFDAGAVWHYGDPLGEQRAAATEAVAPEAAVDGLPNDRKNSLSPSISLLARTPSAFPNV